MGVHETSFWPRDLSQLQAYRRWQVNLNSRSQKWSHLYHDYKNIWQPTVGEVLVLKREPANDKDSLAVRIKKHGQVVGHVPHNLAPLISYFLAREVNKGMVRDQGTAS